MAAMTKALGALAAAALGAALAHSSALRRQVSKASDVVDRSCGGMPVNGRVFGTA